MMRSSEQANDAGEKRVASDGKVRPDAAFERLKEFSDFTPKKRVYWLEFRQAYEKYRDRLG